MPRRRCWPPRSSAPGDELHGGAGGDFLYGNLRMDFLFGDAGKDFLHGDFLSGPAYAVNARPATTGGARSALRRQRRGRRCSAAAATISSGAAATPTGSRARTAATSCYGGGGIDVLVLDVSADYAVLGGEVFDGHFGNRAPGDALDDNATDILLIPGTNFPDTIRLSQTPAGLLRVEYTDDRPTRVIQATWRDAQGRPLVEQFSISTLGGNDVVEFAQGADRARSRAT